MLTVTVPCFNLSGWAYQDTLIIKQPRAGG